MDKDEDQHPPGCACCEGGVDEFMRMHEDNIAKYGYSIIHTQHQIDDEAPLANMSYTVGFAAQNMPELVVFALHPRDANIVLNNSIALLRRGELVACAPQAQILRDNVFVMPVTPQKTDGVLNFANSRAEHLVPALQIVLPDGTGNLPWDPGYNPSYIPLQPLIYKDANEPLVPPVPQHPGGDDPAAALTAALQAEYAEARKSVAGWQTVPGRPFGRRIH